MKYTIILALLGASMSNAIILNGDKNDVKKYTDGPYLEADWITIPKFDITKDDKHWGHEVERTGHNDWLDNTIAEIKKVRDTIPPMPDNKGVRAIWDS